MVPDRPDWPLHSSSRAVMAAGIDWHVQFTGAGPIVLLLHGTGGATHSWAPLVPWLASSFTVVVPDLPGHGFSSWPTSPDRLSIRGISDDLSALLAACDVTRVEAIVGHSAGAALAIRLGLDGIGAKAIVGVNAALGTPPLMDIPIIADAARLVGTTWLASRVATSLIDSDRLLSSTGSAVSPRQRELYRYLFRSPDRVRAVLSMMAQWDLAGLWRSAPALATPVTLIAAEHDRWVPPSVSTDAARRLTNARVIPVAGLGHLAHEEAPERIASIIRSVLPTPDVPPSPAPA